MKNSTILTVTSLLLLLIFCIYYYFNILNNFASFFIVFLPLMVLLLATFSIIKNSEEMPYKYTSKKNPTPEEVIESINYFMLDIEDMIEPHYSKLHKLMLLFGWKKIGSGCYAHVYGSPCGKYAIKFNLRSRDRYPYYAQLAINNPQNPYTPNIYWHFSPINNNLIKAITLLEKLKPIDIDDECEKNKSLLSFQENTSRLINDKNGKVEDKNLNELIQSFRQLRKIVNFRFDTHGGNWMSRNGQVVLTDPIV